MEEISNDMISYAVETKKKKVPIFVNEDIVDELKKYLPQKIYDKIELKYELGFMHDILGDINYKEEVETIIKAKRGLSLIPIINYKLKHK